MSFGGTLRITSAAIGAKVHPAPMPMRNSGASRAVQLPPTSATAMIHASPPPKNASPASSIHRPPSLTVSTLAGPAITNVPTDSGSSTRPDLSALNPSTDWR